MTRFGTQARRRWRNRAIAPLAVLLGLWAAPQASAAPMPAGALPGTREAVAPAQFYGPRFGVFIRPPLYRPPIREPEYEEVEEEYAPPPRPRPVVRYRPLPARPVVRVRSLRPRSVATAPLRAAPKAVRGAPVRTAVTERARPRIRTRPVERASAPVASRPRVARVERPEPPPPRRDEPIRVERVRPPPREEVFVPRGESTGGGNVVPRRFDRGPQVGDLGPRGEIAGTGPARPTLAPPPRGDITGGGSVGPGRSGGISRVGDFRPRGESAGTGPTRPTISAPRGDITGGGPGRAFRRPRPPGGF